MNKAVSRATGAKEKEKVVVHLNEFEFNPEPPGLAFDDQKDKKARTANK